MELTLIFSMLSLIVIFIYGTENFSKEMQKAAGTHFQSIIKKATKNHITSTIFGAIITAITNSSAATTLIAIGLVNAGSITFAQSLGIIFGANIGTTLTAQLIAWRFTDYAPAVIVFGFILSLLKTKYKVFGKPIFYLGLILFSMNLISQLLIPLRDNPFLIDLLAQTSFIPLGLLVGFIVTNLFFSSTVTTGLVVVLAQIGLIGLPQAIPIIFGANIGTTTIGLIVSRRMDAFAKRAALSHFLFNFIGVLIFIPLIGYLVIASEYFGGTTAQQVANAHLIFNVGATIVLLIFIKYFQKIVEFFIPTEEPEIVISAKLIEEAEKKEPKEAFDLIEKEFKNSLEAIIKAFFENKKMLFSKTTSTGRIAKIEALTIYVHEKTRLLLTKISTEKISKEESTRLIKLARVSKMLKQLGILSADLEKIIINVRENDTDFSDDAKLGLDECISKLADNLILLRDNFPVLEEKIITKMKNNEDSLRTMIASNYKKYFERLVAGQSTSGSIFSDALGIVQDAEAKVREIRKIMNH
jgi:phosphate:Na+ symporter